MLPTVPNIITHCLVFTYNWFKIKDLFWVELLTTGTRNWPSGSLGMLVRKLLLVGKHNGRADGTNRE